MFAICLGAIKYLHRTFMSTFYTVVQKTGPLLYFQKKYWSISIHFGTENLHLYADSYLSATLSISRWAYYNAGNVHIYSFTIL